MLYGFGMQMDKPWQVLPTLASYTPGTLSLFHPVIRQSLCYLCRICGPWIDRIQIDKARFALVVSLLIAQFTRHILDDGSLTHTPYAIVFLPTFAAEDEREQHMLPGAWFELLPGDRQIPLLFWLQGGIDCVTSADELMQTKRERRKACLRMRVASNGPDKNQAAIAPYV